MLKYDDSQAGNKLHFWGIYSVQRGDIRIEIVSKMQMQISINRFARFASSLRWLGDFSSNDSKAGFVFSREQNFNHPHCHPHHWLVQLSRPPSFKGCKAPQGGAHSTSSSRKLHFLTDAHISATLHVSRSFLPLLAITIILCTSTPGN